MNLENKIQPIFCHSSRIDKAHFYPVLLEYVLYMHISFVYKKELENLKERISDPIQLEIEKQNLSYRLNDDITIYSIKESLSEKEMYQKYYINLIEIVSLNSSLKEFFDFAIDNESKKSVNILFKTFSPNDFKSEKEINEFYDQIKIDFFGRRPEFCRLRNKYYNLLKKLGYRDSPKSVYDNAVGFGNLFDMDRNIKYYCIEIDPIIAKYTKIKMLINGKDPNSIVCGNTLLCPGDNKEVYDLVFSDMPLGLNLYNYDRKQLAEDERFSKVDGSFVRADALFMLDSLHHLAQDGICIVTCQQGFLFRPGFEKNMREYLVKNNYIEGIISFPQELNMLGLFARVVLVLKKNRTDNNIRMLNLTDFCDFNHKSKEISSDNTDKIMNIYYNQKENDDRFVVVSRDSIINNEYDLSFSEYAEIDYSVKYDFRSGDEKIRKMEKERDEYLQILNENINKLKKY